MQRLFRSVSLFTVCFVFGAATLFFVTPKNQPITEEAEMSSMAMKALYRYDYNTAAMNQYRLVQDLEQLNTDWYAESKHETVNHVYSPDQLKQLDDELEAPLPPPPSAAVTKFEEPATCGEARLWVEKDLAKHDALTDLIAERPESNSLPKACVTYTMNMFKMSKTNYGQCPDPKGLPLPGGEKPCSTKKLVNLTYNSFMDAMDCFGFKPKNILPKLSNESGLLINTLGGGFDAGAAQMTITGINFVNAEYDAYIEQMQRDAATRPACARLIQHKALLTKASELKKDRCGFISLPENPLRSLVYSAVLNKINETMIRKLVTENNIEARMKKLGFQNVDIESLIEILGYMSYNAGSDIAFNAINSYVTQREAAHMTLSAADFDFSLDRKATDIDGTEQDVLKIARRFAASPLAFPGETAKTKALKLKRALLLPAKIRSSYKLTFPEHLIYRQNNFVDSGEENQTISADYRMLGAPGYINFLLTKNNRMRDAFNGFGVGANYCSNPNYLKVSK